MRKFAWVIVASALLVGSLAGSVWAKDHDVATVPEYLDYLTDLRASLKEEKPKPLSQREWELFDRADASIRKILQGHESVETLDADQKVKLHNEQELVSGILLGKEDERVLCRREGRVGTNFKQVRCVSSSIRQSEQDQAHDMLRKLPQISMPSF